MYVFYVCVRVRGRRRGQGPFCWGERRRWVSASGREKSLRRGAETQKQKMQKKTTKKKKKESG
jgi:hypothetical protein